MVESLIAPPMPLNLVGVDAFADVALDREAGQWTLLLPPSATYLP
jgi:hypothetical protein